MIRVKIKKLMGRWAIPGWIALGFAIFEEFVRFMEAADWVVENRHTAVVAWFIEHSARPGTVLCLMVLGFLWLGTLILKPTHDASARTASETSHDSPPVDRRPASATPPDRVRTPSAATAPRPNIIVLETRVVPVKLEGAFLKRSNTTEGNALAAVVIFRNDVLRGKPVSPMLTTRAHLVVHPKNGKKFHINSGYWLTDEFNTTDIGPSESATLILGTTRPGLDAIVVPDDLRESPESYHGPDGVTFTEEALIEVKLVGGWDGQYVQEFGFTLRLKPQFMITER